MVSLSEWRVFILPRLYKFSNWTQITLILNLCIFLYQFENLSHHYPLTISAMCAIFFISLWVVFGKISIHPNPNMSLPIYANMLFHYCEIASRIIEFLKPKQCAFENIKILRDRDICNITETDWSMLNIHISCEKWRTKTLMTYWNIMKCIDEVIFSQPLQKTLFIYLFLPLIAEY